MNKIWLSLLFGVCIISAINAQQIAIKSNLVYDATASINIGAEYAINKRISVDLSGNYNGWDVGDKSWKHWMIQPEARYWLFESFNGHFFGVHAMYADYDISRLDFSLADFKRKYQYVGTAYGGGVSYGYSLYVTPRVNIEFTAGIGYLNFEYDKTLIKSQQLEGRFTKSYFGPTKLGISIIYIIK
ncbi:hypothetical protein M2459_000573 [Parabacteroides sp. PF5-5]|uniref:DUF3575 domain-containing protein n=1 Tax=unclassified Parabacteroides TaxID=2649774 RepID=UPI00247683A3|nr:MULTISPECIES: DUF3575 domain-containing protein [unclassified Parabacteroides]MDH6303494.1 hypothetical protein [Parabacteroides sp. PH5-39]MDH6314816.1 hypothetical protein [Parabacteroides sp. PF5-13]MDH6318153.1 hypothetical protein [Parabacteroides sp. PH5-13]MDH6321915.1 hypothetical protein [Parabacteroides sp. PH5-8]MDH6326039.1 hypothetical protein [Parabacteroides sp. PH5-41]